MPELRWTLLILGALFIGVLAFWEIRRKRHARAQDSGAAGGREAERVAPTFDDGDPALRGVAPEGPRGDARVHREPTLTFPEIHPEVRGDRASVARPPVVEIDEASLAELKVEPHTVVDEFSSVDRSRLSDEALGLTPTMPVAQRATTSPLPAGTSSTGPRVAVTSAGRPGVPMEGAEPMAPRAGRAAPGASQSMWPSAPAAPVAEAATRQAGEAPEVEPAQAPKVGSMPESGAADEREPSGEEVPFEAQASFASRDELAADESSTAGENEGRSGAGSPDGNEADGPAVGHAPTPSPPVLDPDAFAIPEPIVEWPDESSRKIIALRLVSASGERFQGRAVRQALAAEGFLIGKYDIFHKPGPDARAVLSAASLTKPGTFSLNSMDGQRYGGLSLFAVLPGPLSPVETFDELLLTARSLNDRLRGALQDERGEPLTPTRSASIRESLAASSASASH
jgi:cell division protein ZipA